MIENNRYSRQVNLPQVGMTGQEKLKNARVLVIGAGGLGCAVLPYLVASGIGHIGLMDGDVVSQSNLHRQVLYTDADILKPKVTIAEKRLKALNPNVEIAAINGYFTGKNAQETVKSYDLIVDATDAIAARYLINDACVLCNKPFVHASIYRFQAQVSVFNYNNGPTYRCLFPNPPKEAPSCAEAGVLGTSVALAGMLQANEVMKIILGIGEVLSGQLLLKDGLSNKQEIFRFKKNERISITQQRFEKEHLQELRMIDFSSAKEKNGIFLDVREKQEKPTIKLPNLVQISVQNLRDALGELPRDQPIFIFCQSGKRSKSSYKLLKESDFDEVYCLKENAPELEQLVS
ncbi:HesA/MoeB/ThiF family protein [Flavimarina sp. Hel_I_48]|uniref:HesA/MoeB/ThiF family protein n=1 Tax=Flavimarina sp. Hel_I_48 TaxID=1392488 RepID=UPI0004DF5F50|nr:HesA/MoeB/ThiF family protein [Flavimarina sp. Hel_I_48]